MSADESPFRIEPCLVEPVSRQVADLAGDLIHRSQALGQRLHPRSAASLADLVRVMNCYYSNLIEGHNTTPLEIEQAMANHLGDAEDRRNLQIEARAHIRLQKMIDDLHSAGHLHDPCSIDCLQWLHRDFYAEATPAMLTVTSGDRRLAVRPGVFREADGEDVAVGYHQPPSSRYVAAFMTHFSHQYRQDRLGGMLSKIIAMPAAHHRLNYIHPFLDGNGRVSRLMSHAMALQAGIGAHGLWSISRGLARGLDSRSDYKRMMAHADMQRQGDRDGRGNLSLAALDDFTQWFLRVCLDQVDFMAELFDLDHLLDRFRRYADLRQWRDEAGLIFEYVLLRGEMGRGDAARVTGLGERVARDLLAALVADGVLGSVTPKVPVYLRFPARSAEILFPTLYPQA